jgi:predicted site-specific integrase-resolvase
MTPELLTLDEYASRLKVCRATVFEWKRKGILRLGCHYLRFGRVVRFVWSEEAIAKMLEDSTTSTIPETPVARAATTPAKQKHSTQIDWNY